MRKLNKGVPYEAFSAFVDKYRPAEWDEIKHLIYDMRLYMLCYEQDCLCGYSEIPIGAENTESHIDHFIKQDHDSQKIFSWDNFVVSTVDEDFGGKYKDNTYSIQKNEYALIFNPVVDDMSQYISFLGNGKMIPTNGLSQNIIDNKYITLWEKLGTEVCKANLFREDYLTDKLKEFNLQDEIKIRLKERINIGERNTLKYYKELVKEIFEELGIKTTAKASIIKKYFSVKNIFNRQTNENELLILL